VGEHETFRSFFRTVLLGVAVLGAAGTVGAFVLGDALLRAFGSEGSMGRTDIALLAAGSAVFLLALQVAQALVAIKSQGRTIIGWGLGVIAFGLGMFVSDDLILQAVLALLIGSAVAFVSMMVLLYQRLAKTHEQIVLSDNPQFILE
jgi:O-antigen/teichoic acid export membrane protein